MIGFLLNQFVWGRPLKIINICFRKPFAVQGHTQAEEYECNGYFSHSCQNGGYYKAILAAMECCPESIQDVPKGMNSKGFDALCSFFRGLFWKTHGEPTANRYVGEISVLKFDV